MLFPDRDGAFNMEELCLGGDNDDEKDDERDAGRASAPKRLELPKIDDGEARFFSLTGREDGEACDEEVRAVLLSDLLEASDPDLNGVCSMDDDGSETCIAFATSDFGFPVIEDGKKVGKADEIKDVEDMDVELEVDIDVEEFDILKVLDVPEVEEESDVEIMPQSTEIMR